MAPRPSRPRAYGEDLAYIHHVGFADFAERSAPSVLALLRRAGVHDGQVVELGCGSGITARRLTRAGYTVLGIDQSAAMLRLARRTAPAARFRRASFLAAPLPPCDAVLALGEVLNYAFDAAVGLPALRRLFRQVHAALRPGGVLIFDVAGPGRNADAPRAFREGPDWAVGVQRQVRGRTLTRQITSFRRLGARYRRSEEVHHLRLYRPPDVAAALRQAGFRVRVLRGYGRMRLAPGLAAFLATKPRRPGPQGSPQRAR